ncbi:MAG: GTPase Era [Gammaproteobacteria bacterium]|jgi:GTP-binding protein Era|nr:GTPase Era [Gammaproteobacteria bacterium]MDP6615844.1 GTPase Era [Gammaproteobacteria bacterium]MDP6694338.1 GTPase Era [Gammaproteobacteria bacterium]
MAIADHRSGYVAVLGRPNVGKSTLVNALVGHKISIVSSKPNTTRHAIIGVLTDAGYQLVFIDTPGLESASGRLINRVMNRAAVGSLESADVVMLVVEAGSWKEGDDRALRLVAEAGLPCILTVNKIDRVKPRDRLLPILEEAAGRAEFAAIVPVSATLPENLGMLTTALYDLLPAQEALYGSEIATDRGLRFRAAEILREKLMQMLHKEVPYGVGVEIEDLEEDEQGRLRINATIWVDRESHKGIVVGKGGQQIKAIGQAARLDLQETLERPVYLESHVKVKRNWSDSAQSLRQLGYDAEQ